MSQEIEAYFSLSLSQREQIRKVLNRAFGLNFKEIQDPKRMELHVISARNSIICLLGCDGWHFEDIAGLVKQAPEYCANVLKKYFHDRDERTKERSND